MTSISERVAKCFAEDGLKLSGNFGDVMRNEGVQWERARTKPLVSALVECVRALELVYRSDPSLAKLNAALEKMEGEK